MHGQYEPQSTGMTLMIFNKADWERSSPEWLRFHSGMESSRGFRNQLSTHGKVAPHTGTGCLLVVGIQRTNTMEQGRYNL